MKTTKQTKSTEATKHEWVMDPSRTIDMRCLKCGHTAYDLNVHSIPKYR